MKLRSHMTMNYKNKIKNKKTILAVPFPSIKIYPFFIYIYYGYKSIILYV